MLIHPNQTETIEFCGYKVTCKSVPNLLVYHRDAKMKELGIKRFSSGFNFKRWNQLRDKCKVKSTEENGEYSFDYELLTEDERVELLKQTELLGESSEQLLYFSIVSLMYAIDSIEGIELKKDKIKDKLGIDREIVNIESIVALMEVHNFKLYDLYVEVENITRLSEDTKKK